MRGFIMSFQVLEDQSKFQSQLWTSLETIFSLFSKVFISFSAQNDILAIMQVSR